MPHLQLLVKDILYAGHTNGVDAETRKQILISASFSLVALGLLMLFGSIAAYRRHPALAAVVFTYAATFAASYIYLRRSANYRASALIIVCLMMSLCLYLLSCGGFENNGPLWFYSMPLLIFYVLGLRLGLISNLLLLILIAMMCYLPGQPLLLTTYPPSFIHRFFASYSALLILGCAYEYTREEGRRELLELSRRLDSLSRHDELTGLGNRRDMLKRLRHEMDRFERSSSPFSILLIDVDRFKQVNDTHGHEFGDIALRLIGRTLAENTQKRDTVARWGGEEFLVLLPDTQSRQAMLSAERLRQAIEAMPVIQGEHAIHLTISAGIAQFRPGLSVTEFVNQADQCLYRAKQAGRNRVCAPPC